MIYLSLERQLSASQGDLAKTINSTANQQKIFSEQTERLSRVLGNTLSPAFTKVLTVANGFLMVIVELIDAFASFVGFEIPEYDDASYDLTDYFDDVVEGADKASAKLSGLRSFDKLNNMTTPTTSSSSGDSSIGGVDQRLLDALTEYDLGLDNINNKAVKIRDTIMEWLGFTKDVNAETGEITWKYDTLGKSIEKIASEVGKNLGENLTNFTNNIDFEKYGEKLAKGINTALNFINSFVDNYSWEELGSGVASGLNKAIEDIDWYDVGKFLTNKFKISIETLYGFVSTLDWDEVGESIGEGINGALENIDLTKVAKTMNKIASGIFDALKKAVKTINWGKALKNIVDGFVELNTVGKIFVGIGIATAISKISNAIKTSKILSGINNTLKPLKNLIEYTKIYSNLAQKEGLSGISALGAGFEQATTKVGKLNTALMGTTTALTSMSLVSDSMKSIAENGNTLGNSLELVAAGLTATASGFMTGASVGGIWGGVIGGTIGLVGSLVSGLMTWQSEQEKLDNQYLNESQAIIDNYKKSMGDLKESTQKNVDMTIAQTERAKELTDELGNYVDENGNVKDSAERVSEILYTLNNLLGTEYKMTDGVITKNGEKVTSYQNVQSEIDNYIEKLRAQAVEEQAIKLYNQTLEEKIDLQKQIKEKQDEIKKSYEKAGFTHGQVSQSWLKKNEGLLKSYQNLQYEADANQNALLGYEEAASLASEGMYNEATDYLTKTYTATTNTTQTLLENLLGDTLKITNDIDEKSNKVKKTLETRFNGINFKTLSIPITADTTEATKQVNRFIDSINKSDVPSLTGKQYYCKLPTLHYETGKYDVPEDGWFRASKGEYFGKFDDGTTYIANNKQITDGIRQSTFNGMMDALMATNGTNSQPVNVTIVAEDDGILNSIKFKEKDRDRQYGY